MGRVHTSAVQTVVQNDLALPSFEGIARIPGPFSFYRGGELSELNMAYESWGTLSPDRDNAILILPGLSPTAHARSSQQNPDRGWWERMIGPGAPIDTDRYFVLCINNLGSCFGSTGPGSTTPQTEQVYGPDFQS